MGLRWAKTLFGALAVIGLTASWSTPLTARGHCAAHSPPVEGHHGSGHGHDSNNSGDAPFQDCSHCPPAECASQSSCSPVSNTAATPPSLGAPCGEGVVETRFLLPLRFGPPEKPPTPPPQAVLRSA